jgi:excisionase family DNA binding protein
MNPRPLGRVEAVAERLDAPAYRIYELVRRDLIPHVRIGRSVRFDMEAIEAWIAAGGTMAERDAA